MTDSQAQVQLQPNETAPLPFAAPFRQLTTDMPFNWLRKGWADFRSAPRQSLGYGIVIAVLSWIVTGIGLRVGSYWSALILLSGFVFVAPVLAMGLYSIRLIFEGNFLAKMTSSFSSSTPSFTPSMTVYSKVGRMPVLSYQ